MISYWCCRLIWWCHCWQQSVTDLVGCNLLSLVFDDPTLDCRLKSATRYFLQIFCPLAVNLVNLNLVLPAPDHNFSGARPFIGHERTIWQRLLSALVWFWSYLPRWLPSALSEDMVDCGSIRTKRYFGNAAEHGPYSQQLIMNNDFVSHDKLLVLHADLLMSLLTVVCDQPCRLWSYFPYLLVIQHRTVGAAICCQLFFQIWCLSVVNPLGLNLVLPAPDH